MLEKYEDHPLFDINGTWESESGRVRIWFPVIQLSNEQKKIMLDRHRIEDVTRRTNKFVDGALVKLVEVTEPTATEDHSPLIQPGELYLEEPTGGVMLIEAKHDRPHGERALETCALIAADAFSDFMFEKPQKTAN